MIYSMEMNQVKEKDFPEKLKEEQLSASASGLGLFFQKRRRNNLMNYFYYYKKKKVEKSLFDDEIVDIIDELLASNCIIGTQYETILH